MVKESFPILSFQICKYFDIQFSLSMGPFNCHSVNCKHNLTFLSMAVKFIAFRGSLWRKEGTFFF